MMQIAILNFYQTIDDTKYFKSNPEQDEIYSLILARAWRTRGVGSIKKAISRFLKIPENQVSEKTLVNSDFSNELQDFWDKSWRAQAFWDNCISKSFQRQEALNAMGLIYEPAEQFPAFQRLHYLALKDDYSVNINSVNSKNKEEIIDAKDLCYVIVPDPKDLLKQGRAKYHNRLIDFVKFNADKIIDNNYDEIILKLPKILNWAITDTFLMSNILFEYKGVNPKAIMALNKISKKIDKDLIQDYETKKTPKKLVKLTSMYCDVITECLNSDYNHIRILVDDIYDLMYKTVYSEDDFKKIEMKFMSYVFDTPEVLPCF